MKPLKTSSLIETKLLRILEVILTERNITRAATVLRMSQPAVSAALKKIRTQLGDPLVVSDGKTLILTARAERVHEMLKRTLLDIQNIVLDKAAFDPAESTETFKIATTDNIAHHFFTHLFEQLYKKAPLINVDIMSFGQDSDPFDALKLGNADVAVGNWAELPDNLHYSHLYHDSMVCLMRKDHPYAQGITKQQYLDANHVAPSPYSVGKRGVVDTYLSRHRLKRNVVVTVPFFNLAPYAIMETDLIFTVNRSLAQLFATQFDLAIVDSPLPFPIVSYVQLWHERTHQSHALIWLRKEITIAAKSFHSNIAE
jgi:DNA-binding transcriptional LysR family regulator